MTALLWMTDDSSSLCVLFICVLVCVLVFPHFTINKQLVSAMKNVCAMCGATSGLKSNDTTLFFHRFPIEYHRRQAWMSRCNLKEHKIKANTAICSKHFKDFDYNPSITHRRLLNKNAVPEPMRIIRVIPYLKKEVDCDTATTSAGENSTDDVLVSTTAEITSGILCVTGGENVDNPRDNLTSNLPRNIDDLSIEHFSTPRKGKRSLAFVKEQVAIEREKVRKLTKEKMKLINSISSIKDLVQELREMELITEEASDALMVPILRAGVDV